MLRDAAVDEDADYSDGTTMCQFGWDGTKYLHLSRSGTPIDDWAGDESTDFSGNGVDTTRIDPGPSLFLKAI